LSSPVYSISFQHPAPSSAGHTPPHPSRPAGQTLALVGLGPGKTAHQAPLRPSRIQKRPNHHLYATCSWLGSTRLAPGPGRGVILQDYVTAMRPSDGLEISPISQPPYMKNIARAAECSGACLRLHELPQRWLQHLSGRLFESGVVWNSSSERRMAGDRPDHDPGPGLAFIFRARPDLALD